MHCTECKHDTEPINHNGRGWRCGACWAPLPEPEPSTPITPDWIVRNTPDLTQLGIDGEQMLALHELDIVTLADVATADAETLQQIKGIGPATAAKIKRAAKERLHDQGAGLLSVEGA